MKFDFDINLIIPYKITKYSSDLRIIHPSNLAEDERAPQLNRDLRQKLGYIIDKMGEASAKAQGLKEIITSTRKLNLNDNHRVYLIKEPGDNNGNGTVVGMLKVGEKKLFIYDSQGQNHEMCPFCVLDFYVCENQQRKGYGRTLYDYMLRMENISPEHIAIDAPSEKSIRFLKKHYNLKSPISQNNSYVVFAGFFENRLDAFNKKNNKNEYKAYSSFSANPYVNTKSDFPPLVNEQSHNRSGSVDSKYTRNQDNYGLSYFKTSNANYRNSNSNINIQHFQPSNQAQQQQQHQQTQHSQLNSLFNYQNKNAPFITETDLNSQKPLYAHQNTQSPFEFKSHSLASIGTNANTANNTIYHSNSSANISSAPTTSTTTTNINNNNQNNEKTLSNASNSNQQNTSIESYNQSKINSFYNKHFGQNNKYTAFPSLVQNYGNNLSSKPPLPPSNGNNPFIRREITQPLTSDLSNDRNIYISNQIPTRVNTFVANTNDHPFPSLVSLKTAPELFSNQSYMSSKFRKTKLW